MKSNDLQLIQDLIRKTIVAGIKKPMVDFEKLQGLLHLMEVVDDARRKAWHDEKFGPYEAMADQVFYPRETIEENAEKEIRNFSDNDIDF